MISSFLKENPDLQNLVVLTDLLDIVPSGVSIATDISCENIIHNPFAATCLQIKVGEFFHQGKLLEPKDMPLQRSAWFGEEISGFEIEIVWEDGTKKVTRWNSRPLRDTIGTICGSIAVFEEITDLMYRAEERFSKAFYRSLQQKSIVRLSDRRYIDTNESFAKARNLTRDEIIGKTPVEIGVPPEESEKVFRYLEEQGSIENIEVTIPKKNATWGTALLSVEQINIDGERCGLFDYIEITEMKKIQTEMLHVDRLNLVEQMAAGIGHEIRNPMTTVRGYLQLLGTRAELAEQKPVFELMIEELDRANYIITEFLSLANHKLTQKKRQSLNVLLNYIFPLIHADAFSQDRKIVYEGVKVPELYLDSKEITQLVLNLCRNGLEAMDEGGCLTIRIYEEKGQVVLSVQDEGHGIPTEYINQLGTPFFTTKGSGTGLGLATCYRIADSHNAKIEVETGTNGTTFYVRFTAPH